MRQLGGGEPSVTASARWSRWRRRLVVDRLLAAGSGGDLDAPVTGSAAIAAVAALAFPGPARGALALVAVGGDLDQLARDGGGAGAAVELAGRRARGPGARPRVRELELAGDLGPAGAVERLAGRGGGGAGGPDRARRARLGARRRRRPRSCGSSGWAPRAMARSRSQRRRSSTLASVANLTRDKIIDAWRRLGELAHAEGKSIDIVVVGGAVMAVYFQSRPSTADVDGIFAPAPETRRWAQTVADELDLPGDWLNDGAKGYLTAESEGPVLHRSAGIIVRTVALAQLLALKLMAWRDDVDFGDALRILQALKEQPGADCSSPEKLSELVEPYFVPSQRLKASYALEELWELHDHPGADRGSDPSEEPA